MSPIPKAVPEPEPMDLFPEAMAYLAKAGVTAEEFPPDKLARLQVLLTIEPDAGCRVWPDPTWDPNECMEACDDYYKELGELKAFVREFQLRKAK